MLNNYRHNDIVLNFYRSTAYRLDMENIKHLKDLSRCRLANFNEIELFEKLEKTQKIIYLKDLNINDKWNKGNKIEITLTDRLMRNLIDISKETGERSPDRLINYYFSKFTPDPENIKDLKNSNTELKARLKEIKKFINSIKI